MAVEKFPDEISSIRALLAENQEGLTIKSISELLGLNRHSTATSLNLLQMQGRVTLKRVGVAKIYCPANKLPVDAVLKLSNNAIIVFSKAEVVVDINTPFRNLLQLARKEIIGKTTGELPFSVESHIGLPRLVRDGLKGKESSISTELVLSDHSLPCTLTIQPVFFESGDPGVALIADIQSGARSPPCTDNDTNHSPAGIDGTEYICRFTRDGTLTYVNQAYCDLLQKSKAELIGHTWRPTLPGNEYKKIKQCIISLDSDHPVAPIEFKSITSVGDCRWQRWIFRNLFDQNAQSTGYIGTGTDITKLKNLEEKVRKGAREMGSLVRQHKAAIQDLHMQIYKEIASHEKTHFKHQFTQFAMDHVSYLIMWVSHEGQFVYINKEAGEVLGYPVHELQAKKFLDIISRGFSFLWDDIWDAIQRDHRYTLETSLITNKGKEIPVEMVLNYLEFKEKQYCCCFAKDITERKQAEDTLHATALYTRSLIEASLDPFVTISSEGKITDVNAATEHVTGLTRDNLIGTDFSDYFTDPEQAKEGYQRVFTDGTIRDYPLSIRDHVGHITRVLYNATVYRDETGHVSGVFAAARDITEIKRTERCLYLVAEILSVLNGPSLLPDSISNILAALKRETGFDAVGIRLKNGDDFPYFVQDGFSHDFLLTENTLIARDAVGGPCRDEQGKISLECTCGLVLSGQTDPKNHLFTEAGSTWTNNSLPFLDLPIEQDPRLHPRNKCIHQGYLSVALIPIRANREIIGLLQLNDRRPGRFTLEMIHFFEGIVASIGIALIRKHAEDAQRESETYLRSIIDVAPIGIGVVSNRITQTVNDQLCRMIGYTAEELIGKSVGIFYPTQEDYDYVGRELYAQIGERGPGSVETRWQKKDGTIIDVVLSSALVDPQNPSRGVSFTALDITERKGVDVAISQLIKKLNLLSSITRHDMINQLTTLMGQLELMELKMNDPSFSTYFYNITGAAERISDMIQFAKEYEAIGVKAPLWQDCRKLVDTAAKEIQLGKVVLKNDFSIGREIFTDPLIVKAFYNLMDNAIRHGEKITTIRFSAYERNGNEIIVCEDDGIGIPADVKEKIFERGFDKNIGLGLALSREILDIAGISIKETGVPGKGARFEMVVPKGMWRIAGIAI